MSANSTASCKILVPSGVLGAGCPDDAFQQGMRLKPDVMAVDAGSTDSGPYYLATGTSKMSDAPVRRDLMQMIRAQAETGIPIIIGSCGTCGSDAGVDHVAALCKDILKEIGHSAKIARIYSEQDSSTLKKYLQRGAIAPLPPMGNLTPADIDSCNRIVGLAGAEVFAEALEAGADIILAGRATDTAVISAYPLLKGFPAGASWHAAKIAECGGLCTENMQLGGVMLEIDREGFTVAPLHEDNRCTPRSVSAHMLYENADPYRLREPGVVLCVEDSQYQALDDRRVRVTHSEVEVVPPTIKLEGARLAGYQAMSFVGVGDPAILAQFDRWLDQLIGHAKKRIASLLGYTRGDYEIDFRPYGAGALNPLPEGVVPTEVGLMVVVTAESQSKANEILRLCNPLLLHFPYNREAPLPSFAFPYSPAEVERGAVYEFCLNHIVEVGSATELHRMVIEEVKA